MSLRKAFIVYVLVGLFTFWLGRTSRFWHVSKVPVEDPAHMQRCQNERAAYKLCASQIGGYPPNPAGMQCTYNVLTYPECFDVLVRQSAHMELFDYNVFNVTACAADLYNGQFATCAKNAAVLDNQYRTDPQIQTTLLRTLAVPIMNAYVRARDGQVEDYLKALALLEDAPLQSDPVMAEARYNLIWRAYILNDRWDAMQQTDAWEKLKSRYPLHNWSDPKLLSSYSVMTGWGGVKPEAILTKAFTERHDLSETVIEAIIRTNLADGIRSTRSQGKARNYIKAGFDPAFVYSILFDELLSKQQFKEAASIAVRYLTPKKVRDAEDANEEHQLLSGNYRIVVLPDGTHERQFEMINVD